MRRASIIQFVFCLAAIGRIGVIAGGAIAGVVPVPIPGSTAMVTGTYYTPSATDLFDVSQGAVVVSASPTWGNPNGCLGGEGFFEGLNNTLFGDGSPAGAVKTLVFSLPNPISVNTIFLGLSEDGGTKLRGAAGYSLLGLQSLADAGVVLSAGTLAGDYEAAYGDGNITVQDSFPTFTGSIFRLNLTQRTDYYGPRIQELDGFLAPVPEPSTWVMGAAGITCAVWRAWRRRNRYGRPGFAAALLAIVATSFGTGSASAVTIDWVTVGNPGNAADTSGYGAVNYEYRIGKYEVTIGQYTDFLNSVASDDPNGLYDWYILNGGNVAGISRDGVPGTYTYNADGPRGQIVAGANSPRNRPVTYTSWYDAARFANWMSNGQPNGPQNAATTENGAYNLTNILIGQAPARNAINPNTGFAPAFFIPNENEWYKAAYYSPALNDGQGGYYTYATQSNTLPGNLIGGGTNQANWYDGEKYSVMQVREGFPSGQQNYLTNVGAFTASSSFYGTFDQNGNVLEWNDLSGLLGNKRGLRGGGWQGFFGWTQLSAFSRETANPENAYQVVGFRLGAPVAVPEPSTWVMIVGAVGCASWRGLRRKAAA